MWNDIDLYQAVRDFTTDNVSFPGDKVREFIRELVRCSLGFFYSSIDISSFSSMAFLEFE